MDGNTAVERVCDQFEAEGIVPTTATSLTFVTWEEIIRTVLTAAGECGVLDLDWPESGGES